MDRPEPHDGMIVFALPNRGLPWGWTTIEKAVPFRGLTWATVDGRYYSGYQDEYLLPGEEHCPPLGIRKALGLLWRHVQTTNRNA